jgi:hypothetical protein
MQAPAAKRNARAATTTTTERGDPRPHYERGNALLFAGDSKGAIAAYREAIRAPLRRPERVSRPRGWRTSSRRSLSSPPARCAAI